MTSRRNFLGTLLGVAASVVVAPKIPLVIPKAVALPEPNRTFWLPPEKGWLPPPQFTLEMFSWDARTTALDYLSRLNQVTSHYAIEGYYDPDLMLFEDLVGQEVTLVGLDEEKTRAYVESVHRNMPSGLIQVQLVGSNPAIPLDKKHPPLGFKSLKSWQVETTGFYSPNRTFGGTKRLRSV